MGNKNLYLGLVVVILAIAVWFTFPAFKKPVIIRLPAPAPMPATTPLSPKDDQQIVPAVAPSNVFIGRNQSPERKVNSIFTTRKKSILYQALVRYEPVDVPSESAPGIKEILQVYGRQGRELPRTLKRVDQETEMITENLGVPLRFISSVKLYLNPDDGRVIAYDMAQTTGGQPQRMLGHVSKTGMAIEVYRGGILADKQDITFVRDTFIPVEFSFIPQWYEAPANRDAFRKRETIKFSIFVPEAMAQVLLLVKPMDDQVIPVGDATYDCAHYEVLTVSTQSTEGLYARQEMWFDKATRVLMRRQDFDASMTQSDAPVTDLEPYSRIEQLGRLSELPVAPPEVAARPLDFLLDKELNYNVTAGKEEIGQVRILFSKIEAGVKVPPFMPEKMKEKAAYFSTAHVRVDTGKSLRNETAVTLFDDKWKPIHYETHGEENVGAKLNYTVAARFGNEKISITTHRDALTELRASAAYQGAKACGETGILYRSGDDDSAWRDPLQRVPINEDEANAQETDSGPRLIDHSWTRPLPDGIFISDYNRVEHLALLAARLPLPPQPTTPDETAKIAYQKAAIYLVRQNRCGVMLFEIRAEPKPKLTERQKKRLTDVELKEPPLFVASATAAMMPCHMLLSPDGRILELSMKYGSSDVTYTLDDPVMRHRAAAAKRKQLQEGPRIIRPPWW